jgi:MFS family permease
VGLICYGFGVSPGYYSWGLYADQMREELGLSRQQIGEVFGIFNLVMSAMALAAGYAITRWGLRRVVSTGALVAAAGFFLLSRAQSSADLYLGFAIVAATGLSFSTVLPAQTLAIQWFEKYRARATSIILVGGALVGMLVNFALPYLERMGWRVGWVVITGVSVTVALIAALFLRNRPEDLGLERDGAESYASVNRVENSTEPPAPVLEEHTWTAAQAVRTPHFYILTLPAVANSLLWGVFSAHGPLHLKDLGFSATAAGLILGSRVGVSMFGRLTGSIGDFFSSAKILGISLLLGAAGMGGLIYATSLPLAYASVVLLGFGYGAGYISVPVAFGDFFGRRAFAGSAGVRYTFVGISLWLGPSWAGAAADAREKLRAGGHDLALGDGLYTTSFAFLCVFALVSAVAAFLVRHPGPGPQT